MDGENPKDALGVKKVPLAYIPPIARLHLASALMNGAVKYGPWNWRKTHVKASIYLDAAQRHIEAWQDGEEIASDSGVHHLGHAMACLAILLDAAASGCLVDDRPLEKSGAFCELLKKMNDKLSAGGSLA